MMEDVKVKIEIEDPMKAELVETDRIDNNSAEVKCQALIEKKNKGVKSEVLELEDSIGSDENLDSPKARVVLEELKKNADLEDPEFLNFKREIPEFHSKHENGEVKLEADELIIKEEAEETDNDLQVHGTLFEEDQPNRCYNCPHCSYEAKMETRLKNHMLTHSHASEEKMFSCQSCSSKFSHKTSLSKHVLVKHTEDAKKYRCDFCSYQSLNGNNLDCHVLRYHAVSPEAGLRCDLCDFRTRHRCSLKKHASVHMADSEVEMFPCESCHFRTRHKTSLRTHVMAMHTEGFTNYECHHCSHRTKTKGSLRLHILRCLGRAPLKTFKCRHCDYETMYKGHLKRHKLRHLKGTKIVTFPCRSKKSKHTGDATKCRCDRCSFQTKVKTTFKNLINKHN